MPAVPGRERLGAVMDYHVITPAESQLVMQTADGRVVLVLPAPGSSLPAAAAPAEPAPGR
jgi:hypothetical protein